MNSRIEILFACNFRLPAQIDVIIKEYNSAASVMPELEVGRVVQFSIIISGGRKTFKKADFFAGFLDLVDFGDFVQGAGSDQ